MVTTVTTVTTLFHNYREKENESEDETVFESDDEDPSNYDDNEEPDIINDRYHRRQDKNKIPYEEYNNPWITIQDIRICSIRKVPLPRIVNNIYKPNPEGGYLAL